MPRSPSNEHVAAFDVSVHDAQAVHVLQGHAQLGHPILCFAWVLVKGFTLNYHNEETIYYLL